ncbi:MAG: GAF domain-containing protein [Chloroflexi bacterium]|nr:GAF domain-containing protein [Chloroflexota bacterium]
MSLPEPTFSTMDRQRRNAALAGVSILAIAFLNIAMTITYTTAFNWQIAVEVLSIAGLILLSVFSIMRALRGDAEQSVWMLIVGIMIVATIRTVFRQEIGLPFGILSAIIISIIGTLTLPLKKADRALIIGYLFGSLIVIFDAYADRFYLRLPTAAEISDSAGILAGFVFVFQILLLIFQGRTIGLGVKIANSIASITLVIAVLLGTMSITIIRNTLAAEDILSISPLVIYGLLQSLRNVTIVMGATVTVVGSILGVVIARLLTDPLNLVTETSAEVARGNLSARVPINRSDEVGMLGLAFNSMADELSTTVEQLESRVAERTHALERRAVQIQTAAEIGNAVAKVRNLDQLLAQVTQLISERFGYYHTGIFLLDEHGEFAVLRAANSSGGQRMLMRGHRLKVGQVGIVGYVTGSGNPRIALDVGSDAAFFDNPDLPDTRSELALPLIAGGRTLGALDVQSVEESAFTQDDISTLRVLADQVSVAIENARLFEQNQNAIETIRRAYGDISQTAWQKMQRSIESIGFISSSQGGLVRIAHSAQGEPPPLQPTPSEDGLTLTVPMRVRGHAIGSIRLSKPRLAPPWTAEEITVVSALTDQLSSTLESARLYQEAQVRAATERQTTNIVNQIRSSTAVDGILQNTIRELGRAFNASRTFITINVPEPNGNASLGEPMDEG